MIYYWSAVRAEVRTSGRSEWEVGESGRAECVTNWRSVSRDSCLRNWNNLCAYYTHYSCCDRTGGIGRCGGACKLVRYTWCRRFPIAAVGARLFCCRLFTRCVCFFDLLVFFLFFAWLRLSARLRSARRQPVRGISFGLAGRLPLLVLPVLPTSKFSVERSSLWCRHVLAADQLESVTRVTVWYHSWKPDDMQ